MSKAIYYLLMVLMLYPVMGCINKQEKASPPLYVVLYVDLARYTGTWYEIARYPHKFQEGVWEVG